MKYKICQKDSIYKIPYNAFIQDISYDMYRVYTKQDEIPRITIDVTRGLIRKFKFITGRETSSIFLYEIKVLDFGNKCQFTVTYTLSE